jgi:hypothetical protein
MAAWSAATGSLSPTVSGFVAPRATIPLRVVALDSSPLRGVA